MRLLSGITTLALATQALSSPSDFEIRPGDEVPLQPEGTEGIPFRHQVPEKGQRKPDENEDIKMDGWRRGFSELKKVEEPALKTFEKRKGGGGGGGGGGRSSGSSSSSGSKSGGTPSGASSSNSGSRSGGSASSLGTGALAGGAVGYMARSHDDDSSPSQNQSTSPSPQNCHYDNTHDDRLYFTLPPQLPEGKNMTVSVKTTWHLGYNEKLKGRLEKEAGLISTADPGKQCGWHTVQDVVKNTIHRGLIEFNVPENTTDTTITATATANNTTTTATSTSTPTFPPALQAKMLFSSAAAV
ncbi:hypothetical protein Vi05172_g1161 [Venturia inaequalis]|nr:hypothetical protein Vi05172_g1161 [Venturia inaequalis]